MLVQQLGMLGNIPVIEICYACIEQDIKEIREVKYSEIEAVICDPNRIVHYAVDPENPERLDQEVQEKQQGKIGQEFFLHERAVRKI
jgi:hypothetical protein